jgi:hypothetical protein
MIDKTPEEEKQEKISQALARIKDSVSISEVFKQYPIEILKELVQVYCTKVKVPEIYNPQDKNMAISERLKRPSNE